MVTNLEEGNKKKCHQYWPEFGAQSFGPFQVTITEHQILADYTVRHFSVQVFTQLYLVFQCEIINNLYETAEWELRSITGNDSVPLHSLA